MCRYYNLYVYELCGHEATADQVLPQLRIVAYPCPTIQGSGICAYQAIVEEVEVYVKAQIQLLDNRLCPACQQAQAEAEQQQLQALSSAESIWISAQSLANAAEREGVTDPWLYARLLEARGPVGSFCATPIGSQVSARAMHKTGRPGFIAALQLLQEEKKEKRERASLDAKEE